MDLSTVKKKRKNRDDGPRAAKQSSTPRKIVRSFFSPSKNQLILRHHVQCQSLYEQLFEQLNDWLVDYVSRPECGSAGMQMLGCGLYRQQAHEIESQFGLQTGTLYVAGSDETNQLGETYEEGDMSVHKRWKELKPPIKNVVAIAAGGTHSAVVDNEGQVWTWGSSDDGVLGRKKEENVDDGNFERSPGRVVGLTPSLSSNVPIRIEDQSVVKVVCGDTFNMALTRHGTVYFWGTFKEESNRFRPMPPPDVEDDDWGKVQAPAPLGIRHSPRQVLLPQRAMNIFAGLDVAAILLEDSKTLMTFGLDYKGELGRGITEDDRKSRFTQIPDERPKPVPQVIQDKFMTPKPVIWPEGFDGTIVLDVSIGSAHMMVVGRKLDEVKTHVFCAGHNPYGQLGMGGVEDHKNVLTLVPHFEDKFIGRVACGDSHTVFVNLFGLRVFSCGRFDSAQLGNMDNVGGKWKLGEKDYRTEPERVWVDGDGKRVYVVTLAANNERTMLVTHDVGDETFTYYGWGFNLDNGSLGFGINQDIWRPERYPRNKDEESVMAVALGGQHSLLLMKKKQE